MDREALVLQAMGSQRVRTTTKVPGQLPTQQANAKAGFKSCVQDSGAPAGLSKASLASSLHPILVTTSAAGSVGCSLTDPSSRHQLPVLQLNSVLTASTWSWHRTPQVKGYPR